MRRGKLLGRVELGIPGKHNILNSLAAIALADSVEADFKKVVRSLATFAGAKRRFETSTLSSRFRLVDDYGHHPTELAATLQTAKSFKPRRVVVLFQPHRYSRTQALANDFGKVLQLADRVFVADVYPASETPIPGVSGETIIEAAKRQGDVNIKLVPNLATAHHAVGNALQAGDMLITLGAGNVHEAGSRIASDLKIIDEMLSLAPDGCLDAKLYEPMRRHTTMLVGGPAQYWIEPHTFESFALVVKYCRERSIPVRVIGRGSNLLVRDGGIRGAVIHPCGGVFSEVKTDGLHITAGAGVRLKKLANVAAEACIGGFEWMEGIPANVGGALRMNAGAMGVETFDHVISVTFLDEDGIIRTRSRNEIETSYRNVPELSRSFAMQAVFRGVPDTADNIHLRLDASREKRRTSQPVAASAGCVFKNPAPIPAGKLVDELGMKGTSNGRAKISEIHGNFIVNEGGATTADVLALIERIRHEVRAKHGIELDTEVKILGEEEFTF